MPLTELRLIDKAVVEGDGTAVVEYHCITPFCSPLFALNMGMELRHELSRVPGIKRVNVAIKGHFQAETINRELAEKGE